MSKQPCLICSSEAEVAPSGAKEFRVVCNRCGIYCVEAGALPNFTHLPKHQVAVISGWVRQNQHALIKNEDFPRLMSIPCPTVAEKAERVLKYLARIYPMPGENIFLSRDRILELQGVSCATQVEETKFLIHSLLGGELQYVTLQFIAGELHGAQITPAGWAFLDSLRTRNPESQIGFIAMWFDETMNQACDTIYEAIRIAGYTPFRVDKSEHNNKIDDEILAGIRRSKFLVADFTQHRGGVYFEAGFAKGLGLEVIWLCRKDHLSQVHFDTRQYAHIIWEEEKLPQLRRDLQNRIEATIGRGPSIM